MSSSQSFLFLATILLIHGLWAAQPIPIKKNLQKDVETLATPAWGGRATGTEGEKKASAYLVKRMLEAGIGSIPQKDPRGKTPFHLPFQLVRHKLLPSKSLLNIDGTSLQWGRDYVSAFLRPHPEADHSLPWHIQLVDAADPKADETIEKARNETNEKGLILAFQHPERLPSLKAWNYLRGRAIEGRLGLPGVMSQVFNRPTILLTAEGQRRLGMKGPGSEEPGDPKQLRYEPALDPENLNAINVAGWIPGRDPRLKDEVLVLTAHYDHLEGMGAAWFPGADDNASGCAAALEVGRRLAARPPRRSVVLLFTTAEELGMLGAKAFLMSGVLDPKNIKANLNLDMLGRLEAGGLEILPSIMDGPMTTLIDRARVLAMDLGIPLRGNKPGGWASDHLIFAEMGTPVAFLTSGIHKDFHRPTDTPEKLDYTQLALAADLAEALIRDGADAEDPPGLLPIERWKDWTWPVKPVRQPSSMPHP